MMEEIIIRIPEGKALVHDGTCPKGCSLMNNAVLISGKPAVTCENRMHGRSGLIHFDPYYGNFNYESELPLTAGDVVNLACPQCGESLTVDEKCMFCNVNMFAIHLPNGGEVRACPVVGCHNHKLILVDLDAQFAKMFNEELKPKM
jgi:hypothetical protein